MEVPGYERLTTNQRPPAERVPGPFQGSSSYPQLCWWSMIYEVDNTVYAVEIKATKRPGPRDFQNLNQFEDRLKRPIKRILFYPGEEYSTVDGIRLIPIGALHRGK
jgi:hypothetical protein